MNTDGGSTLTLLSRLSLALTRIAQTVPRTIASPVTQPRRASVAILIRVKPHEDDDEWLSEQYDADGQPLPGSEAERIMCQSGLGLGTSVDDKVALPVQGRRGVEESFTSVGGESSSAEASFMGASALSGVDSEASASSAVDLAGISTGDIRQASSEEEEVQQHKQSSPETITPSSPPHSPLMPSLSSSESTPLTLQRFFSLPWVQRGQPEILYIKRASRLTDNWSSHVAFPGGRKEDEDENGLYTAMRETWEEIGLDLAEKEFVNVGKLDDREITTSLGKRLLMVLSPYGACTKCAHSAQVLMTALPPLVSSLCSDFTFFSHPRSAAERGGVRALDSSLSPLHAHAILGHNICRHCLTSRTKVSRCPMGTASPGR